MADLFHRPRSGAGTGTILVVGLGRFGTSAAESLHQLGIDVIAVDSDADRVNRLVDTIPNVVRLDATDPVALRQLGLDGIHEAVVAMAHVEASIVTVLQLKEAGVRTVWAKASSRTHGEILRRIGADHVVYPERAMGVQVAHAIGGRMLDYFEFADGFAMARTYAPQETWGKSLAESAVRTRYDVTVVGVKRSHEEFVYSVPETVIEQGDELIVSGKRGDVEAFARRSPIGG